jgi:hypothetical protein
VSAAPGATLSVQPGGAVAVQLVSCCGTGAEQVEYQPSLWQVRCPVQLPAEFTCSQFCAALTMAQLPPGASAHEPPVGMQSCRVPPSTVTGWQLYWGGHPASPASEQSGWQVLPPPGSAMHASDSLPQSESWLQLAQAVGLCGTQ